MMHRYNGNVLQQHRGRKITNHISITHLVFHFKRDWVKGYWEVTGIVCIENPLTTNERLTFLTSVLRSSPADTFITLPGSILAQCPQVLLKRQTSLDSMVDRENGWINNCSPFSCPPSFSIFLLQPLSHEPLFPTDQASVQPRVWNGNTNPPE